MTSKNRCEKRCEKNCLRAWSGSLLVGPGSIQINKITKQTTNKKKRTQDRRNACKVPKHALGSFGPGADLSCLRQCSAPGPQKEEVRTNIYIRQGWTKTQKHNENWTRLSNVLFLWSERYCSGCERCGKWKQRASRFTQSHGRCAEVCIQCEHPQCHCCGKRHVGK